ncbi:uncharacterized protein LOC110368142 isoform X2 [Fundulus heteroclitus]|uniref:uncharacterized protein LOC110368142 isoform X2 n=1 Tax=Fundulus heteroclitus TaxID=8078 RepID=UPI00165BA289|nr:uncharacterized protein LOC110368142 isoform X2 [Fundulus heteroclitus]
MKKLLLVGILLHVSLKVSAVEILEGGSILLSCDFPTDELVRPTVAWIRSDLSPPIVHKLQPEGGQLEDQNRLYRGRTSMKTDALTTGDLSLNLTKLQVSDTGTYTCTVRTSKGELKVTNRELLVKEQFPSWVKHLLVLLVPVLIVSAGLLFYCRHYFMSEYNVEVDSGEKSVLLPCRSRPLLPGDARVEWSDNRYRTVHVYQNGSDQDQFYRNRTKMNKNPLRTGDLSVTLEHPTDEDNNIYTCRVSSREGTILMKKQVQLKVKVPQVEVDSGEESVLLPCRTTVTLPGDARVEWRDRGDRKVHVYENGSDHPGEQNWFYYNRTKMNEDLLRTRDLSLTLEHPTDGDTNIYTCIVSRGKENILMKKRVYLQVKVPQVVVDSEEKSVLLPCRTTFQLSRDAKVEWRDGGDRKVHVYENSSDHPQEQNRFYKNRIKMNEDLLRTGDLSLTLEHPTNEDTNIYTCIVSRGEGNILMKKQVNLRVKVPQVVEVDSGKKFVLLPCRTTVTLPADAKVEWRDRRNRKVRIYENGSEHSEELDQRYRNRTKMNEDLLRTGDLSLTLEHLTDKDTNLYTCSVFSRDGNILMKKQVDLQVKDCQVEVEEGAESVLLPFTTTGLPEDAGVFWWDKDSSRVHFFEKKSSDQHEYQDEHYQNRTNMKEDALKTGDLSLTLKRPTEEDSGEYRCRVKREGELLRAKNIHLKVKAGTVRVQDQPKDIKTSSSSTELSPLIPYQSI